VVARARTWAVGLGQARETEMGCSVIGLNGRLVDGKVMKFAVVVGGGPPFYGKHIHSYSGFLHGPEPILFGKAGFCEEGAAHFDSSVPMAFNGAVLGLSVGWGGSDADSMRAEKCADRARKEPPVKVASEALGNAASVNEESPESVGYGVTGEVR
jgi:hypothetical protein